MMRLKQFIQKIELRENKMVWLKKTKRKTRVEYIKLSL